MLNSTGKIGDLLMNSDGVFQFFCCDFLKTELDENHERLKKISGLSDFEIETSKARIFSKITFINTLIVPVDIILEQRRLSQMLTPTTRNTSRSIFICKVFFGQATKSFVKD